MKQQDLKKAKLPDKSGVYFFVKKDKVLYVGKATSLRDRVRSYFTNGISESRGPLIVKMIDEATGIRFQETDSVLEALIQEANLIKKHQPFYNSLSKDDKSWNYVVITDEKWPKITTIRGHGLNVKAKSYNLKAVFGPFPHGFQLREALKIIRRIFPFRDNKCTPCEVQRQSASRLRKSAACRVCFNRQIGLCPGVCTGEISQREYIKIVRNIILLFEGKKKTILKDFQREMKAFAGNREFEKADEVKRKIFALEHIQDIALLKNDSLNSSASVCAKSAFSQRSFRIEAYDIAHISGKETVGVMVALENGEIAKSEYRKFKIRGSKGKVSIDDTRNLKEVLVRRLKHSEWPLPNLVVVDGSTAQIRVAREILKKQGLDIVVVSVVKNERHKPREIMGLNELKDRTLERAILLANSEAHRFAIGYHRALLRKRSKL